MIDPLAGPEVKVERAHNHIKLLYNEAYGFFNRDVGRALLVPRKRQAGTYPLELPDGVTLPVSWGVLIGETAYNLRSALDQLLCQLIIEANPGSDWRLCREKKRYYPICLWGPRSNRRLPKGETRFTRSQWLGLIRPRYITLIEDTQPYFRRNGHRLSPLWLLKELSDSEKHNLIVVAGGYDAAISIRPQPITSGVIDAYFEMDAEPNAEIADVAVAKSDMNVRVKHSPEIRFGEGCAAVKNLGVVRTLKRMADKVEEIVKLARAEIP